MDKTELDRQEQAALGDLNEAHKRLTEAQKQYCIISDHVTANFDDMVNEIAYIDEAIAALYSENSQRLRFNDSARMTRDFKQERLLRERSKELNDAVLKMKGRQKMAEDELLAADKKYNKLSIKYHRLCAEISPSLDIGAPSNVPPDSACETKADDLDYNSPLSVKVRWVLREMFGKKT